MSLRYALASDCGRERNNNEDAARVVEELGLFVIADGMGGHVGGEIASRVAVETFITSVKQRSSENDQEDPVQQLSEAMLAANTAGQHEAESRNLVGMGTTVTALRIQGQTAIICHIGDTRAALVKDGTLEPLTRDHTIVSLLVDEGVINAEDARNHPERHMLTQAIGTQDLIEPDIRRIQIPPSARILLSTDGLHDIVPSAEIAQLASGADLDAAVRALIDRANEQGGPDNITVILLDT
jgi:protein phosphatase